MGAGLRRPRGVAARYRQTIRAYPHGGGSYIVATENLGRVPGLIAAAGLMTDYILTVAVSVASGIAAITSAVPSLTPDAVPLGVGAIAVLLAGNLRGVRQAGLLFAAPTYTSSGACQFARSRLSCATVGSRHRAASRSGEHPRWTGCCATRRTSAPSTTTATNGSRVTRAGA